MWRDIVHNFEVLSWSFGTSNSPIVKASMGLDSMTCTKSELVVSTLKE